MKRACLLALILALLLGAGGCALRLDRAEPVPPPQEELGPAPVDPDPAPVDPDPAPVDPDPAPVQPDPAPPTGEDLLKARAQEIMAGMTLEEKIGQMFFARRPASDTAEKMAEYQLGGYLLFLRDFQTAGGGWLTAEQLAASLEGDRAEAKIAPFFGVDEEGGTVARASRNPNLFSGGRAPSPRSVAEAGGEAALAEETFAKNSTLLLHGINVNFAPVADVATDPAAFMYQRAVGESAEETARLVETMVAWMKQCRVNGELRQIGVVLKHFPGYGNCGDTHTGAITDDRPYEQFEQEDFLPFAAGIAAGADAVLVSHNTVTCMDPDLPASLSPEVHRILREELGFDGVIMTDDLAMGAVTAYDVSGEAAVLAIAAGNDMLVTTDFEGQIAQVALALEDGTLTEQRLDESVLRILLWKLRLGVIE